MVRLRDEIKIKIGSMNVKSCFDLSLAEYHKVGDGGYECKDKLKSIYTYTALSYCDGWKDISLDECKKKCTNNEVPDERCPRQHAKCAYVQYYEPTKWCHLADKTCEPIKSAHKNVLLKKPGLHIYSIFYLASKIFAI